MRGSYLHLISNTVLHITFLSYVIESIVHSDHSIFSNFTLLHDIIDLQETDECATLVSLDQEKAFDRVTYIFLLQLFEVYGFRPDFCR